MWLLEGRLSIRCGQNAAAREVGKPRTTETAHGSAGKVGEWRSRERGIAAWAYS
jgi:hypothetical protein